MAGMGAGYDLSVSTFSPDGRVFQVEYAMKAIDNSGTTMAILCQDGIVFGVEKYVLSKMTVPGTCPRIFAIDRHVTIAIAGLLADARQIVSQARHDAKEYRRVYGEPIPGKVLAERIALYMHAYTLAWSERPFGAAVLLGVCGPDLEPEDPQSLSDDLPSKMPTKELYCIDPAGVCYRYFGTALGKGRQTAKTEIEKLDRSALSCRECLFHIARILRQVHDEAKEKDLELEMSWLCANSNWEHEVVPKDLLKEADERATRYLEQLDEEDVE